MKLSTLLSVLDKNGVIGPSNLSKLHDPVINSVKSFTYELVSGFSSKSRIRVWAGAGFRVRVGVCVRVTGVFSQVKYFDS